MTTENIAVIGSSGTIGGAVVRHLLLSRPTAVIHAFSSSPSAAAVTPNLHRHLIDYASEDSMAAAARISGAGGALDLVFVATGLLHDVDLQPEKSLRDLSAGAFQRSFAANSIVPALVAKHVLPQLACDRRSVFAVLSARVGSISDNRIGGWYAYRASKAALNMIVKTASIEVSRRNRHGIVVGLHPGTVDSALSRPFQRFIPQAQVVRPETAAASLISVIDGLSVADSGKCFAWDGSMIAP